MSGTQEFTKIHFDNSKHPHVFAAFRHHSNDQQSWDETVELCLQAWRLNAEAYRVVGTGFSKRGIERFLNGRGRKSLPKTPPEDKEITKNPFITDITEVLALKLLKKVKPGARFPHPRVLHKEARGLQHHGIDILGYEQSPDGYTLLIVEVMASVSAAHPPSTVKDHFNQLKDTLNPQFRERLLEDLSYVHDECTDPVDKEVLNQFIIAATAGNLKRIDGQQAVGILIRPVNLWLVTDWKPFFDNAEEFEKTTIPATVWFGAIECDSMLSALMDKIKATVTPPEGGGNP